MGRIRQLPDEVANQIAAGEVVERPAAVVKELVENALDAGARRIEVEIRGGGLAAVRVLDDGSGMDESDARLALVRHATSKIAVAADLDRLGTFGFRGEALPSIASVSVLTLRTRRAEDPHGFELHLHGGHERHARACAMPTGTEVTVEQLFVTVPARRKFLRTEATEASHCIHAVRLAALAHPEVAFTLIEDGHDRLVAPACLRPEDRLLAVFGRERLREMAPLHAEEGVLRLTGWLGRPATHRTTRHELITFVNRRPVESRLLTYAFVEAFHGRIPERRFPVAVLNLEIPPAAVDVNVHPAKREVRFRDESRVRGFLVRAALQWLADEAPPAPTFAPGPAPLVWPAPFAPVPPAPWPAPAAAPALAPDVSPPQPSAPAPTPQVGPRSWRWLGTAQGRFAVFDTATGVVLVDGRAAQGRILYERLLRQEAGRPGEVQALLLAETLQLPAVEAALLREHADALRAEGFDVREFGREFFRIEAVPTWIEPGIAPAFVRELVGLLRDGTALDPGRRLAREALARLAAARAVGTRIPANAAEAAALADALFRCEQPLTAPDGRGTLVELTHGDLERRFARGNSP